MASNMAPATARGHASSRSRWRNETKNTAPIEPIWSVYVLKATNAATYDAARNPLRRRSWQNTANSQIESKVKPTAPTKFQITSSLCTLGMKRADKMPIDDPNGLERVSSVNNK